MRVPHADHLRVDVGQAPRPKVGVGNGVFVERIARRRMHQEKFHAVKGHALAHWQVGQKSAIFRRDALLRHLTRHAGQVLEAVLPLDLDELGDAVIVIAADGVSGFLLHPRNARGRFQAVIDQISQDQTRVERLVDRLQGRPVRVEVGQQQYPHEDRCLSKPLAPHLRPSFPSWSLGTRVTCRLGRPGKLQTCRHGRHSARFLVPRKSYPGKRGKASEFDRIPFFGL